MARCAYLSHGGDTMNRRVKAYTLAAISALVLVSSAYAQRITIRSGYGLRTVRDSNLTFLSDSIAVRKQIAPQIADSIALRWLALSDSLDANPRNALPPYDSLRRIGASPIAYYGHASWTIDTDTAGIRLFGLDISGGLGAGSSGTYMPYTSGHAVRTFLIDAVEITHSFDTTAFLRRRDTVIITNGLDSIPAGSDFWFSYHPRSDATFNGTGAPIIRLFYATLNATSGTYHDSFYWKIPQILGVRLSHRGVRADHRIKVTLWVREKIPGRVY